MRKVVGLGVLAAAAGLAFWRSRSGGSREHVDLYFVDGSMVSLRDDAADSAQLLARARDVLAASR